jgi:uncharacterized membrane protein YgcG
MKSTPSYFFGSSFRWGARVLLVLTILSSCSTSKESSYAYMDDIYKTQTFKSFQPVYYMNETGDVADQDGSVILPYASTISRDTVYVNSTRMGMSFGYSFLYSPFGRGYGNSCYPYGNPWNGFYGHYPSFWFNYPYGCGYSGNYVYGYNNLRYRYYNDYSSPAGGDSYIYREKPRYFYGINPTGKRSSYAVNYAKYSNYRAIGTENEKNGRKSGSAGKNRYQSGIKSNKSNSNVNPSRNSNGSQGSFGGSSRGGSSPSRSSGSGGSGSYSGKRPR